MITKNVNGNTISAGFISQIQSDTPNIVSRIWYNGAELSCDIVDITVEKGSCGQEVFMIGDVIGDILTANVKNLSTDIKDQLIQCHIGALVNGSYEYISLGTFRVSEVRKTRYESKITAFSSVVADTGTRFDVTGLSSPTLAQLASRVAGKLNCTVTFDNGINTSLVVEAQLSGLTYYQVLQVIAICSGGYVVNTHDGNVKVRKFSTTSTLSVNTGMMTSLPEFAEQPYEVTSVGVLVEEATVDNEGNEIEEVYYSDNPNYIIVTKQGTDYYLKAENGKYIFANVKPETADIYFSCPYMTESIFHANVMGIKGYTYSPATVNLTLGDPRLEGCDVLTVTDVDSSTYIVPCHNVIHKYTGGFTSEITSCEASDNENNIGTSFPITQRIETVSRKVGTAQATAENAYKIAGDTNQYFWFAGEGSDTGAHITETPQDQFLADPTNGGGNLLARSNGVAIRDGLDELAIFSADQLRIGMLDANRAMVNSGSMQLYDDTNTKYFEVSPNGMSYGAYTVATTDDVNAVEAEVDGAVSSTGVKTQYYLSTSSSSATGGTWEDTVPTWTTGTYIWTRVATTKITVGGTQSIEYSDEVYDSALTSALINAETAQASADTAQASANSGASTVTTTQQFGLSTTTTDEPSSYTDSAPTWESGKYVWIRYKIVKTTVGGNTTTSYTTGVYDKTVTDALSSAKEAERYAKDYLYIDGNGALNIASSNPSTATRKVRIASSGVRVQEDVDNHADVTSSGLEVYQNGNSVAEFGNSARVGKTNGYKTITSPYGFSLSKSALELFQLGIISGTIMMTSAETTSWKPTSANVEKFFSWLEGVPNGTSISAGYVSDTITLTKGEPYTDTYLSYDGNCTVTTLVANVTYSITKPAVSYNPSFLRFGQPTKATDNAGKGNFSTAFGTGVIAEGNNQTVVGKYNVADSSSLFVVGNGTSSTQKNALQVDSSSNLRIKGDAYVGCSDDSTGGTLLKVLKVTKSSVSSLSTTITNSSITANMECIHSVLSNPSVQTGDWTVTTSAGSVSISGNINGTTDITLYLAEPST